MGPAKAALESAMLYLADELGALGIRVNLLSPSPIKTPAGKGISDFNEILAWSDSMSPLSEGVTFEEIGDASLYPLTDIGRAVTSQILLVDKGASASGMPQPRNAGKAAENQGRVHEIYLEKQAPQSEASSA